MYKPIICNEVRFGGQPTPCLINPGSVICATETNSANVNETINVTLEGDISLILQGSIADFSKALTKALK